ncbi:MAG: hypothetical protein Q7R30_03190 [Acidobacteriota bacterium]|nr:hypothetical protein [Acidobacteriota bacterium]
MANLEVAKTDKPKGLSPPGLLDQVHEAPADPRLDVFEASGALVVIGDLVAEA